MASTRTVRVATGSLHLRSTYFGSPDRLVEELEELFKLTAPPTRRTPRKPVPEGRPLGLSTSQAAAALGVSLGTIRRWADMGYLESYRTPSGQRRFSVEQIEQFLETVSSRRSERAPVGGQEPTPPRLRDVAAALVQTERYIRCAEVLMRSDWPDGDRSPEDQAAFARSGMSITSHPETSYRVVSVRMVSPLEIVIHLSPEAWTAIAVGLVLLAERICTFGPRVSRTRRRALFEATVYEEARQDLLAGRADGLALSLLSEGPAEGPTHIDFLDPDAPSDEHLRSLERVNNEDDDDEVDS